jgi:hypothetical protein
MKNEKVNCPICSGSGILSEEIYEDFDLIDVIDSPCEGCEGTGLLNKVFAVQWLRPERPSTTTYEDIPF